MLNKDLIKELNKAAPSPLYYLWSEESCFLEEALSKFIESVIDSNLKEFNYDIFDSSSEIREILNAASTLPFMSQRRLVVIKDFHEFSASAVKNLMPYFTNPVESTCMVILSKKAPKVSMKVNWKVYSLNIHEQDIPAWLKYIATQKGIKLTNDAIDCLIELTGQDIGLLMMEVEKLTLSGKSVISEKDILSFASMMRKYTSFDLVDSLIAGQKTRAFRILKTIFGGNPYEAPVILGTLNWHYKQFYSLWLNKGKKPLKMREGTYKTLTKYLSSFREEDFYYIFQALHEADIRIKTSGNPEVVLELLLIKLLQKGAWS
jgi:DNA polymerase-3 subunit delta